jgi:uncharacterized protein (UPF0332 family)
LVYSQQRNIFVKRDVKLTEPPDAEPHVRWCERSAAKAASYSIDYKGANNRAYYSIFHAINAVHAVSGKAYKRHKDAVANFNKDYVKTSVFPREMGRKIGQAEEIRHASDYDDFYIASKEESERQISVADEFIILAEKYCMEQLEKQKEN